MFENTGMTLGLYKTLFWLAQVGVDRGVDSPEDAALVFSGPRLYFALIAGVVLAPSNWYNKPLSCRRNFLLGASIQLGFR